MQTLEHIPPSGASSVQNHHVRLIKVEGTRDPQLAYHTEVLEDLHLAH